MLTSRAPTSLAIRRPAIIVSYSAIFLIMEIRDEMCNSALLLLDSLMQYMHRLMLENMHHQRTTPISHLIYLVSLNTRQ
jgi:hypothetical protein